MRNSSLSFLNCNAMEFPSIYSRVLSFFLINTLVFYLRPDPQNATIIKFNKHAEQPNKQQDKENLLITSTHYILHLSTCLFHHSLAHLSVVSERFVGKGHTMRVSSKQNNCSVALALSVFSVFQ